MLLVGNRTLVSLGKLKKNIVNTTKFVILNVLESKEKEYNKWGRHIQRIKYECVKLGKN